MELVRTYIPGFDDVLGGGIPKGSVVLISGPPGTRKTTLAYAILHSNAKHNVPSLFIHLEESTDLLRENMKQLGMEPLDQRNLYIVDVGNIRRGFGPSERHQDWNRIIQNLLAEAFDANEYQLLALDSLPLLYSLAQSQDPRTDLFHLVSYLKDNEVTTILINEVPFAFPGLAQHSEDFLVDGIIYLRSVAVTDIDFQLRMRVVKMRGIRHQDSYHAMTLDSQGFHIADIFTHPEVQMPMERPLV